MQETERILNDEAEERVAPPILTESSVVPVSTGEAAMQDDPLPMCTWSETTTQGVEARVVQLPDGQFVPAVGIDRPVVEPTFA
eukprot:14577129-Alexandrium_andersonii.AAC.1